MLLCNMLAKDRCYTTSLLLHFAMWPLPHRRIIIYNRKFDAVYYTTQIGCRVGTMATVVCSTNSFEL